MAEITSVNHRNTIKRSAFSPAPLAPATGSVRPVESQYDATIRLEKDACAKLLDYHNKMVGLNQVNDILKLGRRAEDILASIKSKYPKEQSEILREIRWLYLAINVLSADLHEPGSFSYAMSMFMQVNDALASLLSRDINADKMISAIKAAGESIGGGDERVAFRSKYGIDLAYTPDEMTEKEKALIKYRTGINPPDHESVILKMIDNQTTCHIDTELGRYPLAMITLMPKRIAVILHSGGVVSYASDDSSVVTMATPEVFHHELYHWLKKSDPQQRFFENFIWTSIVDKVPIGSSGISCTGYATDYGKKNEEEDQATVAAMLFTSKKEQLRSRLLGDAKLLAKVELITGCEYNVKTGRFVKVMGKWSLSSKYGIYKPLFYAKWSNVNGRVLMDADYWNSILRENQNGTN